MSVPEAISLIKALSELVGVLIWPAVTLFVVVRFSAPIANFVRGVSEFTFKAAGVEATAKTRQVEAALAIGAAIATQRKDTGATELTFDEAKRVAGVIARRVAPPVVKSAAEATLLWVDDHPENNTYERRAMAALGIEVELSTSTDDALARLETSKFDVIIS